MRRMSVFGYVRPGSLFLLAAVILVNAAANGAYADTVVGVTKDTLDCVLCLDTLVLKSDDSSTVRRTASGAIESLRDFAISEGIDVRIGLIAYANHRLPDWLDMKELTGNVESILDHIAEIEPRVLYAALAIQWAIILGTVTVLIIQAARPHPGSNRPSTVPPVN